LFLHHIYVEDFSFEDEELTARLNYQGEQTNFKLKYIEFEGFTCVYTLLAE